MTLFTRATLVAVAGIGPAILGLNLGQPDPAQCVSTLYAGMTQPVWWGSKVEGADAAADPSTGEPRCAKGSCKVLGGEVVCAKKKDERPFTSPDGPVCGTTRDEASAEACSTPESDGACRRVKKPAARCSNYP